MSCIKLEFSRDNELMAASFQADNHVTPPSPDVKIGKIDGRTFLKGFYRRGNFTLKDKQGEVFQISIDEILNCFTDGEDQILYLIYSRPDNLCAVLSDYDEEEVYGRYGDHDVYTIRKFEVLIAAEEDLPIEATSIINNLDWKAVSGSEILDCYESVDDNSGDESEFGESKSGPPRSCRYSGMCSNYEDDPDMCDKCRGL